jgi:hypothetical protein
MADVVVCLFPMNKADSERIRELCASIAVEQDRGKFLQFVEELNQILERRDQRRRMGQSNDPESE